MKKNTTLIGVASGIGAQKPGAEKGPSTCKTVVDLPWAGMLKEVPTGQQAKALPGIVDCSTKLAELTSSLASKKQFFITIGGDHACAIGTWSGVSCALKNPLGLIWIDAHMDSHTPKTTPSQNIHGMPLAVLLGYGYPELKTIQCAGPKVAPENVILIGTRSYESGEADLLKKLNVRIYYIDEVKKRGLETVLEEATVSLADRCDYFGVSLDIDALDPEDAPGTGTPVENGIRSQCFIPAWHQMLNHSKCVAAEIAEYNPTLDRGDITLNLMKRLLE